MGEQGLPGVSGPGCDLFPADGTDMPQSQAARQSMWGLPDKSVVCLWWV